MKNRRWNTFKAEHGTWRSTWWDDESVGLILYCAYGFTRKGAERALRRLAAEDGLTATTNVMTEPCQR